MKKILLLSLLIIFFFSLQAQLPKDNIYRGEVKGKSHTYQIYEMYNINLKTFIYRYYDINDSLRPIKDGYPSEWSRPRFNDDKALDSITRKYIIPTFKNLKSSKERFDNISLSLIAGKDGIVKEIVLFLPKHWKFPVTVIEDYLEAIKAQRFKLFYPMRADMIEKRVKSAFVYKRYYCKRLYELAEQ